MNNVAIIGCTKDKKSYKCEAIELYQKSTLFQKELKYSKKIIKADDIYILSAKHHLIHSSDIIEPYDITLNGKPKSERVEWANVSWKQMSDKFDPNNDKLFLLCGKNYYEFIEPELIKNNYLYEIPLKGKGGLGMQLQWLDQHSL